MKAISLWQPWATGMALGLKCNETRHWSTRYRGLLAIHAAKRWTREEREWAGELARLHGRPELEHPPLGAIVATGLLVDIRRTEDILPTLTETEEMFGNYAPGRFAWVFADVRPLTAPILCRGAQGFFEVPEEVLRQISVDRRLAIPVPPRDLFGAA